MKLPLLPLSALARGVQYLPMGRQSARVALQTATVALWQARYRAATPSVYGPLLTSRWHDATFFYCVTGLYGWYFSELLRSVSFDFSFVDIGSNIGLYSLIAASNSRCQKCYAFEPNPVVFDTLVKNIELNEHQNIVAYNLAISTDCASVPFFARDEHSGGGAVVDRAADTCIMVRSTNRRTFDSIEESDHFPKIVKIDVEGHEPVVMCELGRSTLMRNVRNIYCEIDEDRFDASSFVTEVERMGFTVAHKDLEGLNGARHYDLMFERKVPSGAS